MRSKPFATVGGSGSLGPIGLAAGMWVDTVMAHGINTDGWVGGSGRFFTRFPSSNSTQGLPIPTVFAGLPCEAKAVNNVNAAGVMSVVGYCWTGAGDRADAMGRQSPDPAEVGRDA